MGEEVSYLSFYRSLFQDSRGIYKHETFLKLTDTLPSINWWVDELINTISDNYKNGRVTSNDVINFGIGHL